MKYFLHMRNAHILTSKSETFPSLRFRDKVIAICTTSTTGPIDYRVGKHSEIPIMYLTRAAGEEWAIVGKVYIACITREGKFYSATEQTSHGNCDRPKRSSSNSALGRRNPNDP